MIKNVKRCDSARGSTATIGISLLLAISIILSMIAVYFAVGGPLSAIQNQGDIQEVDNAFSLFSSSSLSAAVGGEESSGNVNVEFADSSNPVVVSEDSNITVWSEDESGSTKQLLDEDMGYIKYSGKNSSGTMYYENGGVWRITDDSNSAEMVTSPEFHYTDRTLTLPIIDLQNNGGATYSETMRFVGNSKTTSFDLNQATVDEETIYVQVQSPAYLGWGKYFEERVNPKSISYDHSNNKVTMKLGLGGKTVTDYNSVLYATSYIDADGGSEINGSAVLNKSIDNESTISGFIKSSDTDILPADPLVESKINKIERTGSTKTSSELSGSVIENGKYYTKNLQLNNSETLTVDLSNGDVELAVDGNIELKSNSNINVINPDDGQLSVYSNGSVTMSGGNSSWSVDKESVGNVPQNTNNEYTQSSVLYTTTTGSVSLQQNSSFEGILYSPPEPDTESSTQSSKYDDSSSSTAGPKPVSDDPDKPTSPHTAQDKPSLGDPFDGCSGNVRKITTDVNKIKTSDPIQVQPGVTVQGKIKGPECVYLKNNVTVQDSFKNTGRIYTEKNVLIQGDIKGPDGSILIGKNSTIENQIKDVDGTVVVNKNANLGGQIKDVDSNVYISQNSTVQDQVSDVKGYVIVEKGSVIQGQVKNVSSYLTISDKVTVEDQVKGVDGYVDIGQETTIESQVKNVKSDVYVGKESTVQDQIKNVDGYVTLSESSKVQGQIKGVDKEVYIADNVMIENGILGVKSYLYIGENSTVQGQIKNIKEYLKVGDGSVIQDQIKNIESYAEIGDNVQIQGQIKNIEGYLTIGRETVVEGQVKGVDGVLHISEGTVIQGQLKNIGDKVTLLSSESSTTRIEGDIKGIAGKIYKDESVFVSGTTYGNVQLTQSKSTCKESVEKLCLGKNASITGSVVTGSANIDSTAEITYDPGLSSYEMEYNNYTWKRPQLLYIHTSKTRVTVSE